MFVWVKRLPYGARRVGMGRREPALPGYGRRGARPCLAKRREPLGLERVQPASAVTSMVIPASRSRRSSTAPKAVAGVKMPPR